MKSAHEILLENEIRELRIKYLEEENATLRARLVEVTAQRNALMSTCEFNCGDFGCVGAFDDDRDHLCTPETCPSMGLKP